MPVQVVRYGASQDLEGDLHLPAAGHPPVVCLLHGGFWRMPWARDQMNAVAEALVAAGLAVWNLEYRRLGVPGAGWPGTMEDVAAGIEHLARLAADGVDLDPERVIVAGHSAGGHLALWAGGCGRLKGRVFGAVGLAPITDLVRAQEERVGNDAVSELLGGGPRQYPERYRAASPAAMLPLGVRQLILHGTLDDAVPIAHSRRYAEAAVMAGDSCELIELPGTGHMEFLDPASEAFAAFFRWLTAALRPAGGTR
jgi:acetyl esterase/lipase